MKVAIVRYNGGNVLSVCNALERLGVRAAVTDDADELRAADKVIFPGVGHAASAMEALDSRGLGRVLETLRQPVLGICLGMQLLCAHSEEGDTAGLGVFPIRVRRFDVTSKVPHVGWNLVTGRSCALLSQRPEHFYFVHSYFCELGEETSAVTEYGTAFSAVLQKDNYFAVQFHPERSGPAGSALLGRFLAL